MKTLFLLLLPLVSSLAQAKKVLPFVDILELSPEVIVDAKYFTDENFVGEQIDGYLANKCLLSKQAGVALALAQKLAKAQGLSLKVFDCFRPQMAVDHFVRWAKDLKDVRRKKIHYPNIRKEELFVKGYIASRSGHSRGSTIDLTLADLKGEELDMGGIYDLFDPISHTKNSKISSAQKKNRDKLKRIMEQAGFNNYSKEWWHYTLRNEPYPSSYFSFLVK